jgi:hypothetical protein
MLNIKRLESNLPDSEMVALRVKWLNFLSYWVDGEELELNHPKISRFFDSFSGHESAQQVAEMRKAIRICGPGSAELSETQYSAIEVAGFQGPAVVGFDGKGITLKDSTIYLNVDYITNSDRTSEESITNQRTDILDRLRVELDLGDLTVVLTGAFDYFGECIDQLPEDTVVNVNTQTKYPEKMFGLMSAR